MARCMLIDAGLPYKFWGEAVATANFMQNRVITRTTETTPYERWNGSRPSIQQFQVFGSKCFVHLPKQNRHKLENTGIEMIFLRYDDNAKAYRCYNFETKKLIISRDVRFYTPKINNYIPIEINKGMGISTKEENSVDNQEDYNAVNIQEEHNLIDLQEEHNLIDLQEEHNLVEIQEEENTLDTTNIPETTRRRISERSNKGLPPRRLINEINLTKEIKEPRTYKEALNSDERTQWIIAMQEEMESHQANGTWELVDLPAGKTAIGGKWVYKAKTGVDGKIERYKAKFVAQGFSQKYGEDYDEVFAPVVMPTTFRTMLSIAAKRKMMVHHIDVKTAFLNGSLSEIIYMKPPQGYENTSKVCLLKKSIYGLKQAARSWNSKLHEVLEASGFQQSYNDQCLYSKKINEDYCYVIVYVDDLLVTRMTKEQLTKIETILKSNFDIRNLGLVNYYLGMEITRDNYGNFKLCQSNYILKMVSDFGLNDAKPVKTPMEIGYGKCDSSGPIMENNTLYRQLVGRLLYLSINTRPDISASVSILAQKVSKPTNEDWNQLKRVVKYLKTTHKLKLSLSNFQKANLSLHAYTDASWADDRIDRKSNSGKIIFLNGGTISWGCQKQSLVASSTCEAEFISLAETAKEIKWLQQLLKEMHEDICLPIVIYEDNQSCLEIIRDHKFSYRTKHIDTKYKMIRDLSRKNIIECLYCPTDEMIADLMTKPLSVQKHNYFRDKCNIY